MTAPTESRGGRPLTGQRIPDFFIAGHAKCGTTALYEMLRVHPQIYMPDLKEPRFLAGDLRANFEVVKSGPLPETLEEYLALFAPAGPEQRAGEASPSYLRSRVAAGAIAEMQPDARIIAILREPASFVRSLHLHLRQEGIEDEPDLRTAFMNEQITRDGRTILRYSDHLQYVEQLRRYEEVFPPEQILVLIYDDYRRDNPGTVRRVLRFLDVDDELPVDVMDVNTAVQIRSMRVHRWARAVEMGRGPASGALKAVAKTLTTPRLRDQARVLRRRHLYGTPAPADEDFMLELRRRFEPEVRALSEHLGRDLASLWGYDGAG